MGDPLEASYVQDEKQTVVEVESKEKENTEINYFEKDKESVQEQNKEVTVPKKSKKSKKQKKDKEEAREGQSEIQSDVEAGNKKKDKKKKCKDQDVEDTSGQELEKTAENIDQNPASYKKKKKSKKGYFIRANIPKQLW